MAEPTLVVLAAGIGSRYGGLKQMEPVGPGGESIIDYSVYDALRVGFGRVILVIKEEIEAAFRERIGRSIEAQCDTRYVYQRLDDLPPGYKPPPGRQKPWGTAHALWCCRKVLGSAFAVINSDDFYGRSAFRALHRYLRDTPSNLDSHDHCMVGYHLEKTLSKHGAVARGICEVTEAGFLAEIHERTRVEKWGRSARYTQDGEHWVDIPRGAIVSMNMWGLSPSLFGEMDARFEQFLRANQDNLERAEFLLPELMGALVRENRAKVRVLLTRERWFGVTYRQDLPGIQAAIGELVQRGAYPEKLWQARGQ